MSNYSNYSLKQFEYPQPLDRFQQSVENNHETRVTRSGVHMQKNIQDQQRYTHMQREINKQDKEEFKAQDREHDKMNMERQKRWKEYEDQLRASAESPEKRTKKKCKCVLS